MESLQSIENQIQEQVMILEDLKTKLGDPQYSQQDRIQIKERI